MLQPNFDDFASKPNLVCSFGDSIEGRSPFPYANFEDPMLVR
jgi:hypothetical protein